MGCPYLDNQIDTDAELVRNALHQAKIFRPRLDVFAFPEEYVITRHHFSQEHYLAVHHLFSVHLRHATWKCKGMSF